MEVKDNSQAVQANPYRKGDKLTPKEVTAILVQMRDTMLDSPDGVSTFSLTQRFINDYKDLKDSVSSELFAKWVGEMVRTVIKPRTSEQLALPGLGEVPSTVTSYNGEGGFVYKKLPYATVVDLENDAEIHRTNVEAATKALQRAQDRNSFLVPIMEKHGFTKAGDAIKWVEANAPQDDEGTEQEDNTPKP